MGGQVDIHGVLHPLGSEGSPAVLNVPERSLKVLSMGQLLRYVHDFPIRGYLSDRSNLGGALP
jgi:hypothetical protein